MAKVNNPITLAEHLGVGPEVLSALGVANVTLAVDTRLFIDPLLLSLSANSAFASAAQAQYEDYFSKTIKVIAASTSLGDVAWKAAWNRFAFREIRGTCLGYGGASIDGSAWGEQLIGKALHTAKEIISLGVADPDIFPLLALLEDDIGPDRISDMTTNVIIDAILNFNTESLAALGLSGVPFTVLDRSTTLLPNPYHPKNTPIMLIPRDVLRPLPVASDWDGIARAAFFNETLRQKVNKYIGQIWKTKAERSKAELRAQALSSKAAVEALLSLLGAAEKTPYNVMDDPKGLLKWAAIGRECASQHPLAIVAPAKLDLDSVYNIVKTIIGQFRQLVEQNGLAKSLWFKGRHLPEKYAQRLFFAIAYAYCRTNDLDLSPEVDSGNGQVDFKISQGFTGRVLVEIKLSTSSTLLNGFTKQLEAYKAAEQTLRATYLVIDVGGMGNKDDKLTKLRNDAATLGHPVSALEFVNGEIQPSASTL